MKVKNNILNDIAILAAKENEIVVKILIKERVFFQMKVCVPTSVCRQACVHLCVCVCVCVCVLGVNQGLSAKILLEP